MPFILHEQVEATGLQINAPNSCIAELCLLWNAHSLKGALQAENAREP